MPWRPLRGLRPLALMAFHSPPRRLHPKTDEEKTLKGRVRPGETRPLTLKNSANKLIAPAWLFRMRVPYAEYTVDIQRGLLNVGDSFRIWST